MLFLLFLLFNLFNLFNLFRLSWRFGLFTALSYKRG